MLRTPPAEYEELQRVLAQMARTPLPTGAPLSTLREAVEAMMADYPVAQDLDFESISIDGVACQWSRSPTADTTVIIYLHGGGYLVGSAHGNRALSGEIGRAAHARILSVDYRLAPEHPFPAALEDTIKVYGHLLQSGISPSAIAFAGDSAGGGLVVASLLAIRDHGDPLPSCAALISPWLDLACTGDSMVRNAAVDVVLTREKLQAMATAYLAGQPATNPLASPLYADLTGLPPILVQVGSSEILFDDAARFASRAGSAEVAIAFQSWPYMFHVWPSRSAVLGAGREAISSAGAFLKHHLG